MSEKPAPAVDPGHVLPDKDWAAVVARAAEVRAELRDAAEGGASGPGGVILDMTEMGVRSRKYFGVSGIPTQLLVLHSAECPLQAGYAKSLSEWACGTVYPAGPVASWHRFVDPVHRVRLVPDELGAWHASEANVLSIGWEQAGYARFTRDQWLTADGRVQLEMLALDMAEVAVRDGIPPRWLADWEVREVLDNGNRGIKGFCNHRQIDPETRTDPGDGYPYGLLMERIIYYMGSPTPLGQDDDMGTLESITPEAMNNLATMVHGAVKEQLAPVLKSVAFQEQFSVKMLERIAAQSAVSVEAALRILDALAAEPSVTIPPELLERFREEFQTVAADTAEAVKASLKDVKVTLSLSGGDTGGAA